MKKTTTPTYNIKTGLLASALCLLAGGLILLSPSAVRAASSTYTNNVAPYLGDWSDSTKWQDAIVADGATYQANFWSPNTVKQPYVVTLDTPRTIGSISLNSNAKAVRIDALDGSSVLTISGGTHQLRAPNGSWTLNVSIAGTDGIDVANKAFGVTINSNCTYTGDTIIESGNYATGGFLRIGDDNVLPGLSVNGRTGNVVMGDAGVGDGSLDLNGHSITINGLSGAAPSTAGGNSLIQNPVAGTVTFTVGDNNQSGTCGSAIVEGTGDIALTKIGTGTLQLTGDSTYTGDTTVNAGALFINGTIGGGSLASTVNVNGGAIGGSGSIYGAVNVYATGGVKPGASAGTLTIYGGLDMSAPNTTYYWELGANSTTPGDFDVIALPIGSADVTDANLNIAFTGSATAPDGTGFWATDHSWTIISGSVTGNFKNIQNGTNAYGSFYTTGGTTLNFHAVPPGPGGQPKITSISKVGTTVTVNYNNCAVGTNYILQYKSPVTGVGGWTDIGIGKVATGTSDSQNDATASGAQRYYRVYFVQ